MHPARPLLHDDVRHLLSTRALFFAAALLATGGTAILLAAGGVIGETSIGDPRFDAAAQAGASDVPELPFEDNPDPDQCGIPLQWGDDGRAWLTGVYQGELIQPMVLLYDSHLRQRAVAQAPHGTEVEVVLFQQNPVLDYYFVKIPGETIPQEGWIPAPLLSFQPVT